MLNSVTAKSPALLKEETYYVSMPIFFSHNICIDRCLRSKNMKIDGTFPCREGKQRKIK